MKKILLVLLGILGLILGLTPAAQASDPATINIKNSPASGYAVQVAFASGSTSLVGATCGPPYNVGCATIDYVGVGDSAGEGTNVKVFSEPVGWRIPPGWCGRVRLWDTPTHAQGFGPWIPARSAEWPGGRWVNITSNTPGVYDYGYRGWEVQIVSGATLSTC